MIMVTLLVILSTTTGPPVQLSSRPQQPLEAPKPWKPPQSQCPLSPELPTLAVPKRFNHSLKRTHKTFTSPLCVSVSLSCLLFLSLSVSRFIFLSLSLSLSPLPPCLSLPAHLPLPRSYCLASRGDARICPTTRCLLQNLQLPMQSSVPVYVYACFVCPLYRLYTHTRCHYVHM